MIYTKFRHNGVESWDGWFFFWVYIKFFSTFAFSMAIYFKGLFLVSDEQFFLLLIFYTEEQNLVKIKKNLLVLTKVKVMKQPLPRNTWKQLGPIFSRFIIYNVCHFVQFHLSKNVSTLLQIVSFSKFTQICYHSWVSLMSVVLFHGPLIVS